MTYRNQGYGARRNPVANGVIKLNQTKQELAEYLAAALFNPENPRCSVQSAEITQPLSQALRHKWLLNICQKE